MYGHLMQIDVEQLHGLLRELGLGGPERRSKDLTGFRQKSSHHNG